LWQKAADGLSLAGAMATLMIRFADIPLTKSGTLVWHRLGFQVASRSKGQLGSAERSSLAAH